MGILKNLKTLSFLIIFQNGLFAKDYYVHPKLGSDTNSGLSKEQAFQTLKKVSTLNLLPGDRLFLASGQTFYEGIHLVNQKGSYEKPIIITTVLWEAKDSLIPAILDFKGKPNGILIEDCNFIEVSSLKLTGNGYGNEINHNISMRCGILINNQKSKNTGNINIQNVSISDVYYENPGFIRGTEEVRTANGTQKYGWGIRVINNTDGKIENIQIKNCIIHDVSHTGIKFTGSKRNINHILVAGNSVKDTGGPGIQMSDVTDVHVINNIVSRSGSNNDTRKWGRGSGLWTWGSSKVLIEKNKFLYANGPGDSAGAHIDFNCDNIILQYNISAYNAGGFCEILGNNYNCSYRYNVSINDGSRIKGENNAFQEGKIFWLSGYQGEKKERKGPVNTYFYNNTIFTDSTIVPKIAIDNTSQGILIANNIFYLEREAKTVLGDQYKPDVAGNGLAKNVYFKNNLFLDKNSWPKDFGIKDIEPIIGNPDFINGGGIEAKDYFPKNRELIQNKGVEIHLLKNDSKGLYQPLMLENDILGNKVGKRPSLGAIEPIAIEN